MVSIILEISSKNPGRRDQEEGDMTTGQIWIYHGVYDVLQPIDGRHFIFGSNLLLCSVGQIYEGTIVKTQAFGAFVEIRGFKQHGLVHISQLSEMKACILPHFCASMFHHLLISGG